jgi:DNA-binding MarR family transcriptional regulator
VTRDTRTNAYDDARITAFGLFAEAFHGVAAELETQLASHDLKAGEFEVMLRLSRSPGHTLRMTDLAAQTQLTTSGTTRVVDRLERDGLVTRTACPTDRRGYLATLTGAGHARMAAVLPGHLELLQRWFVGLLEPAELERMLASLRRVRDAVRPGATAGATAASPDHDVES